MPIVYFKEKKEVLLCQVVESVPKVEDVIKIKGRKGKVINVFENKNNQFEVIVELEKKIKKQLQVVDKKKRR